MSDPNGPPPGGYGPPPGGYGPPPGPPPSGYGAPAYGAPGYAAGGPPAWGGPPGTYLDPRSHLALPTGTTLATPGRRIGAYFLNVVLFIVTLGIGFVIWGLVLWGRGQTPAYAVLGMRCYRPDQGRVASFGTMALREIVGSIVEGILGGITQLVSFILFLARDDRRSLRDLVASTVVIHDPGGVLAPR